MILVITASSAMFSQLPALSGATGHLTGLVAGNALSPSVTVLLAMATVSAFCMFIDQVALKAVAPDTDLRTVFRAAWPFVALFMVGMAILFAVPEIATLLPSLP